MNGPVVSAWLPRPSFRERRNRFLRLRSEKTLERILFSEFLSEENILFFFGRETKTQTVEALVGTFPGRDHRKVLQAIWSREREGVLTIPPDISILRGRLEKTHPIRAALGICPKGIPNFDSAGSKLRIFAVLASPMDQTHIHANLLAGISSLFHDRGIVRRLLSCQAPGQALQVLRQAELLSRRASKGMDALRDLWIFLKVRFAGADPPDSDPMNARMR